MPRFLLAFLLLGAVIYLIIRLLQRRGDGGGGGKRIGRPVAPDDDPGFLRDLDDQLWIERHRSVDPDAEPNDRDPGPTDT